MNLLHIPEIRSSFAELAAGGASLRCRLASGLPAREASWSAGLTAALRDQSSVASVRYGKVWIRSRNAGRICTRRFYLLVFYCDAPPSGGALRELELRLRRLLPHRLDAPVRFAALQLPQDGPELREFLERGGLAGRVYRSGTELFRRRGWRPGAPEVLERLANAA